MVSGQRVAARSRPGQGQARSQVFSAGTIDASSLQEAHDNVKTRCTGGGILQRPWPAAVTLRYLAGTTIPATEDNLAIVETIEQYRAFLIEKNIDGLLLLASKKYFEDGGTPQANDDYGYDGLREILTSRLGRVQSLRYDIEYQKVTIRGEQAEVDAFLNGAFELQSETGERYRRCQRSPQVPAGTDVQRQVALLEWNVASSWEP